MSARKIRRRTLDRIGRYPRFILGLRTDRKGANRRINLYYPALTYWKSL